VILLANLSLALFIFVSLFLERGGEEDEEGERM